MPDHADAARSVVLRRLSLHNVRNWSEGLLEFGPHINIFHGPNAKGKTSLLEALHLLALGRSFRTQHLQEIKRHGQEVMRLSLDFHEGQVDQTIRLAFSATEKRITLNATPYPSLSGLIGLVPLVITTPDDELIKAAPLERRRFLDLLLAQENPLYLHHLTRYSRALKQRNSLLRQGQMQTIEPWELQLAHAGAYLIRTRLAALEALSKEAEELYGRISESEERLSVRYESRVDLADPEKSLLNLYAKDRRREAKLGVTLYGPHRDDLKVSLNGHDAKAVMSEGQMRSGCTALKLGSWRYLKGRLGKSPALLIDDFGISLDSRRRRNLIALLDKCGQVFITSTDPLEEACFEKHALRHEI